MPIHAVGDGIVDEQAYAFGDAYVKLRVTNADQGQSPRKNPILLFLHGRFSHSATWDAVIPKLRHHVCVRLDFPGYGASFSSRERAFGLFEHVRLVRSLLSRLDAAVVLIGHDVGGAIAAMVASGEPERVAGMVLLNAASPCEPLLPAAGWLGWKARMEFERELRKVPDERLELLLLEPWRRGDSRRELIRAVHAIEKTWPGPNERLHWRETIRDFERAALVLWGGHDSIQPLPRGVTFAHMLPNADFYVDPGSGHWTCLQNSAWVGARIREFVFRLSAEEPISARKFLSR